MTGGKLTMTDIRAQYGRGEYPSLADRAVAEIPQGDVLTLTDWCIDHAILYPTPTWDERQMRFTGWVFEDHSRVIFDDNGVPHVCDPDGKFSPSPATEPLTVLVGSVWARDTEYTYEVTSIYLSQSLLKGTPRTMVAYRCREHPAFHTQMEISTFLLRFLRKEE